MHHRSLVFSPKKVCIKCEECHLPSFSLQWKSDKSTKHYPIQMLLAINWCYWLTKASVRPEGLEILCQLCSFRCYCILSCLLKVRPTNTQYTYPDHVQFGRVEYSHSVWKWVKIYNGHHYCLEQWRSHQVHLTESSPQLPQIWGPSTSHTEIRTSHLLNVCNFQFQTNLCLDPTFGFLVMYKCPTLTFKWYHKIIMWAR